MSCTHSLSPKNSKHEAIDHFRVVDDLDGEARFYNVIVEYYQDRVGDMKKAKIFLDRALSAASQCNNEVVQVRVLSGLASLACGGWEYQRPTLWNPNAGNVLHFKRTIQLVAEGKELLLKTGMEGGEFENMLMNAEAYVYQLKTEYAEARRIHEGILRRTSLVHAPVTHAHALINVAHLDIVTGVSADIVSRTLDAAAIAFRNVQYPRGVAACDVCRADVLLREGDAAGARTEYVRLFASLRGSDDDLACYCLAKLADPAHPVHDDAEAARLPRALRSLGDVLVRQGKADAALSVLTVALDGFTRMDVHQSRAPMYANDRRPVFAAERRH
ncbi:hypothetical protein B0H14DRAFT_3455145 [Mycena olivaceomarginata]|nr:hypothetical protein B0H14DRAFT_3455145 [Mycena olivaceomarginata]